MAFRAHVEEKADGFDAVPCLADGGMCFGVLLLVVGPNRYIPFRELVGFAPSGAEQRSSLSFAVTR